MTHSIIKPRRPTGSGWVQDTPPAPAVTLGFEGETWLHVPSRLTIISAVEVATPEGGIDKGPEYHISISKWTPNGPARCSSAAASWVLAVFDLIEAEEDNHVPGGIVRNFWRPVADRFVGIECSCKADESAIAEDKGDYVWRGVTR